MFIYKILLGIVFYVLLLCSLGCYFVVCVLTFLCWLFGYVFALFVVCFIASCLCFRFVLGFTVVYTCLRLFVSVNSEGI